jgi:hypothetical protein
MMAAMVVADGMSNAEQEVEGAFPTGAPVDLSGRNAANREVRAEVLLALLCGAVSVPPGQVGEVNLRGARIVGPIKLWGGEFSHGLFLKQCIIPEGIDLTGTTTRSLWLTECRVGPVRLVGAKISGRLEIQGSRLEDRYNFALRADGLTVTEDMFCLNGFRADGGIRMVSAQIGGQLSFSGARLVGRTGPALVADALSVTGAMFCDNSFRADGGIRMVNAHIGGQLNFSDARLTGARQDGGDGLALVAYGLTVAQDMYCDQGFRADGGIRLTRATIGSRLSFRGARLDGKGRLALEADGLTVAGDMFCCDREKPQPGQEDNFRAKGGIRLVGAHIGGQLNFQDAHLTGGQKDGKTDLALAADGLSVTGNMYCNQGFHADGGIRLAGGSVGRLIDTKDSWPDRLELDGLTYGALTYMPAKCRLDWLSRPRGISRRLDEPQSSHRRLIRRRSPSAADFPPQPYQQLASYYRGLGHDDQARIVLLNFQRRRNRLRRNRLRLRLLWLWGWIQDILAGYGYAPGRAMLWLIGAFFFGLLWFRSHHPVPVGKPSHPPFHAALYTLDVLVPFAGLGQANNWEPHGAGLWLEAGLHAFGWLLAITVIAAITRSFSRD